MISCICDICGNVGFIKTRQLCGRRACTLHYDSGRDIYLECGRGGVKGVWV
jgi:hypothetical protein